MEEAQELQLNVIVQENKEEETLAAVNQSSQTRSYKWWMKIFMYTIFVLFGQSVALLLARLYFVKGGKSKWMATLVQTIGFPIIIPFYSCRTLTSRAINNTNQPSSLALASIYVALGLMLAANGFLFSIGMQNLPVSTFTLISASQLAFNALFSFFLNSQNFTPFIINSLLLLTASSVLLVFGDKSASPTGVSKLKYTIGFICTAVASAGYGLSLSLTQLSFKKVIKRETFKAIMDMILYQAIVASFVCLVGLFASGEWRNLNNEMEEYDLGKISYAMVLVWIAIAWQLFTVGSIGLIFEVSALFSNAIGVLGLPIVPVLAVIFFHDTMNGIKVISVVLASWGVASYVYQHYLEDHKAGNRNSNEVAKASTITQDVRL